MLKKIERLIDSSRVPSLMLAAVVLMYAALAVVIPWTLLALIGWLLWLLGNTA